MHLAYFVGLRIRKIVIFRPKVGYKVGHSVGLQITTDLKLHVPNVNIVTPSILVYADDSVSILKNKPNLKTMLGLRI